MCSLAERDAPRQKRPATSTRVASGVTSEAVLNYLSALDCPRALTVALLYKSLEHRQLADLVCDPSQYENAASYRDAYMATTFLKKSTFLNIGKAEREVAAIEKFKRFELQCKKTNLFFRSGALEDGLNDYLPLPTLVMKVRSKIAQILGTFDPTELCDLASWGPGVSTRIKGEETFGAKKFQSETGITRDLYPLAEFVIKTAYPGWWDQLQKSEFPSFEVGNQVITVPKTSTIDRVIAVEPGINLWFQLGLGRMIRRRLGKVGIDLTDQTRNQQLAREGSITGELTTVDFSSASDSIAEGLVEYLFDYDTSRKWFDVMDVCRSKYGMIGKEVIRWNKFSSMGNGFTFDLETLIFYAAAVVVCNWHGIATDKVSVYGDDVIIPTVAYKSFAALSVYLGFSVNPSKSFSDGYFRESCGAHYYGGVDCKPVYLVDKLTSYSAVMRFANLVRLRSHYGLYGCDARFKRTFYALVLAVPKRYRFKAPATWNSTQRCLEALDGAFMTNWDEACPTRVRTPQYEGFSVQRLGMLPVRVEVDYTGLLLSRLAELSSRDDNFPSAVNEHYASQRMFRHHTDGVFPLPLKNEDRKNLCELRGRTTYKTVKTVVRQWYDLGPWF